VGKEADHGSQASTPTEVSLPKRVIIWRKENQREKQKNSKQQNMFKYTATSPKIISSFGTEIL